MLRVVLTITVLSSTIAFAAGCGNSGTFSSDAASVSPAGSLLYLEPLGALATGARRKGDNLHSVFALSVK